MNKRTCGFFVTACCGLPGGDSTWLSKTPVMDRLIGKLRSVDLPSSDLPSDIS